MTIPTSEQGYAVDRTSGEVHTRYASHAEGCPRTRTLSGVYALTSDPKPCVVCWPTTEVASYYCEACARNHNEGSLIYERHLAATPEPDLEREPYFGRPYLED